VYTGDPYDKTDQRPCDRTLLLCVLQATTAMQALLQIVLVGSRDETMRAPSTYAVLSTRSTMHATSWSSFRITSWNG
jgi:hypothetical protein